MTGTVLKWAVLIIGIAALVYALIPPVKPQYLSAAGSLIGIGPVVISATGGDSKAADER